MKSWGNGTLFDGADRLLGDWGGIIAHRSLQLRQQLLAGHAATRRLYRRRFIIALKNVIDKKREQKIADAEAKPAIERARVTSAN